MDKQVEIKKIAKILCDKSNDECCEIDGWMCTHKNHAEKLYKAGAVVLTREEYEELQKGVKTYNYDAMFDAQSAYRWEQGYLQGAKETAEKFAEMAKAKARWMRDHHGDYTAVDIDDIDEICNELVDE